MRPGGNGLDDGRRRAHTAVTVAAKALAACAADLIFEPALLREIREKFARYKEDMNTGRA